MAEVWAMMAPPGLMADIFPMRSITDHKVNGLNEAIDIIATDVPGLGGANHRYEIVRRFSAAAPDPIRDHDGEAHQYSPTVIEFQKGPILESGFNGISNEALVAIVIDRMRGFQGMLPLPDGSSAAPFSCRENAIALTHLEDALMWLQKRTRDRMARGVEGTHSV